MTVTAVCNTNLARFIIVIFSLANGVFVSMKLSVQ